MKTALVRAALAGGVLLASTALVTPAFAQAEYKFTLHHFLGPQAPAHNNMLVPWAERIEAASEGRIEIEIYPSMSLGGTPPELIRQVRDGVVDIVWTVNGYTPGIFPHTEVFELPFVHVNDPVATNLAIADLFDEYLATEYTGIKVLFNHVHAGQAIHMVNEAVRSPEDLAGKTIRIPTRTGAWVVEALGANPVSMPVPDLPQALARGVVDGAFVPWEIIPPLQLQDLTDYQIELADKTRLGTTTFQVSMNIGRWNGLPDDIKAIFEEHSGEDWLREVGQIWRDIDESGISMAVAAGNEHITLTEEESAAFQAQLESVVDRWVAEVSAAGIDGQGLVEAARAAIAAHTGN